MLKKAAFILWMIIFSVMFAAGAEIPRTAVVIKAVENMHSASNDAVNVVSQALLGTNVKVLAAEKNAKGEEWFRIETPDTYQGWIVGTSLRPIGDGQKAYASEGKVFEATSLLANIYSTNDVTERKPLTVAPIGACTRGRELRRALVRGQSSPAGQRPGSRRVTARSWTPPRLEEGSRPTRRSPWRNAFWGSPIYWGGGSPYGLDCSGYVQLLYRLSGIDILRDADIQMTKSGLVEVPAGQEQGLRPHFLRQGQGQDRARGDDDQR